MIGSSTLKVGDLVMVVGNLYGLAGVIDQNGNCY
jgi:S1-C subfamily serine protease